MYYLTAQLVMRSAEEMLVLDMFRGQGGSIRKTSLYPDIYRYVHKVLRDDDINGFYQVHEFSDYPVSWRGEFSHFDVKVKTRVAAV
jgi:hypothetical protein